MALELFILIVACTNLVVVIEFVRRRKLTESFALLWTATALGAFALILARPLIDAFSDRIGIDSGTSVVFSLAIVFILVINVYLSVHVTKLEQRVESLAEEVAILHGIEHRTGQPDDAPTGDGGP
jgi:hypothetical protein